MFKRSCLIHAQNRTTVVSVKSAHSINQWSLTAKLYVYVTEDVPSAGCRLPPDFPLTRHPQCDILHQSNEQIYASKSCMIKFVTETARQIFSEFCCYFSLINHSYVIIISCDPLIVTNSSISLERHYQRTKDHASKTERNGITNLV